MGCGCSFFASPNEQITGYIKAHKFQKAIDVYVKYRPELTDYEYDVLTLCIEGDVHEGNKKEYFSKLIDQQIMYDDLLQVELMRQKKETLLTRSSSRFY